MISLACERKIDSQRKTRIPARQQAHPTTRVRSPGNRATIRSMITSAVLVDEHTDQEESLRVNVIFPLPVLSTSNSQMEMRSPTNAQMNVLLSKRKK
eukprot:757436-Hanusia_phi.AAC.2